jgi:predicted phosphodiesterase
METRAAVTRIVILGDVHGNARALQAALARARAAGADRMVLIGDLLTYGHDVAAVIDLVHDAQARDGAALLVGNHDQMYFDLARDERAYFETLPEWIQESVNRTLELVDLARFRDQLQWNDDIEIDDVLLSHACPDGRGVWHYVANADEHRRAATTLAKRGLRAGVFGHTHRARWFTGVDDQATAEVAFDVPLRAGPTETLVANAGAVGQPRDRRACAAILCLDVEVDHIAGELQRVDYDVAAHVAALRAFGLTPKTTERLCGFFQPAT